MGAREEDRDAVVVDELRSQVSAARESCERWREEALSLLATPSACPDDDRSRWREQCLAIAGGAEAPAPPRDSHEPGGYFS